LVVLRDGCGGLAGSRSSAPTTFSNFARESEGSRAEGTRVGGRGMSRHVMLGVRLASSENVSPDAPGKRAASGGRVVPPPMDARPPPGRAAWASWGASRPVSAGDRRNRDSAGPHSVAARLPHRKDRSAEPGGEAVPPQDGRSAGHTSAPRFSLALSPAQALRDATRAPRPQSARQGLLRGVRPSQSSVVPPPTGSLLVSPFLSPGLAASPSSPQSAPPVHGRRLHERIP